MKLTNSNKRSIKNARDTIKLLVDKSLDDYNRSHLHALAEFKEVDWLKTDDDFRDFALQGFALHISSNMDSFIQALNAVMTTKDLIR